MGGLATLTVNQAISTTFGGTIADGAGQLSLSTTGAGTLYLTGINTYTGATYVEGGSTLIVNNNDAIDGNNLGNNSLFVGNDLTAFGGVIAADASSPAGIAVAASPAAAVPEPGTLALVAALVAAGAVYRRLRRTCPSRSA